MNPTLEPLDQRLLNELQGGIPLAADPFAELARRLETSPDDVIERVRRLKEQRIIRQISAIFDTAALGYSSSLVAARIDPVHIAAAAQAVNRHPGVSHNYRRNHEYNLWFTVAVPPTSRLGLDRTVEILGAESGAAAVRLMPALRLFKIGVKLDMADPVDSPGPGGRDEDANETYTDAERAEAAKFPLSESDIAAVRVLQEDLPVGRSPFDGWARQAGLSVADLLAAAARFGRRHQMRRFAAVLHHRTAGFAANAMGVWVVPPGRVDEVGRQMAAFKSVSHCYLRPTYPDWPFNIFTMVHGRSAEQCQAELDAIRRATGIEAMSVLYSLEEYKKVRLRYFTGEVEAWEQGRLTTSKSSG